MAQILAVAFFNSPEEGLAFWPLLEPLRQQNHRITLLTNESFSPPTNQDIEVWASLQTGSIKECIQLFPYLIRRKFDIVHFFHFQENPTFIHHALFWYYSRMPNVVMASSVMTDETKLDKSGLLKLWLEGSDIVTGFNRSALAAMRTLQPKSKRQTKAVLPPILTTVGESTGIKWSQEEQEFLEEAEKYKRILVPYFPSAWKKRDGFWKIFAAILEKQPAIFIGSQSQWSLRQRKDFILSNKLHSIPGNWLLTGESDARLFPTLAKNASMIWLAGLPISSFEAVYWLSCAFSMGKPIAIDIHQASLYPELLKSTQPWCMVLPSNPNEWATNWNDSLEQLGSSPSWMEVQRHADAKINDLSRLYQKALEEKA